MQPRTKQLNDYDIVRSLSDLEVYSGPLSEVLVNGKVWKNKTSTDALANNRIAGAVEGTQWVTSITDCANILDFSDIDPTGNNDNTATIQRAFNECCKAVDPGSSGMGSPYRDITTRLYFPDGIYVCEDTLSINGALFLDLAPAISYAGARLIQVTNGKHLIHLGKDTDGSSNCLYVRGGSLRAGASSLTPGTSLIYGGEDNATDGGNNSLYVDRVWFGTPEDYAIYLKRGDDFQAVCCTFDAAAYHSIKLGSATNTVLHASIIGNTFYDIRAGVLDLINVRGMVINANRVYGTESHQCPYFVNGADSGTQSLKSVLVTDNILEKTNVLAYLNATANSVRISQNEMTDGIGSAVVIGGGGTPSKIKVIQNTFEGDYSGTIDVGGGTMVPAAPIFSYGTGLQNSRIQDNDFKHTGTGTATTPMLLDDSRTSYNSITGNKVSSFSDRGQVANPLLNGFAWTTDLTTISAMTLTPGQRVVSEIVLLGVQLGDHVTLSLSTWSLPNHVKVDGSCSQPDIIHVTYENLDTANATLSAITFQATITRQLL